jgi:hypothetical protein
VLGTIAVVLVWNNGPFGGGKTATTFEWHRRMPGSIAGRDSKDLFLVPMFYESSGSGVSKHEFRIDAATTSWR